MLSLKVFSKYNVISSLKVRKAKRPGVGRGCRRGGEGGRLRPGAGGGGRARSPGVFSARGAGEGFLFSAGEAWAPAEVGAASPRGARAPVLGGGDHVHRGGVFLPTVKRPWFPAFEIMAFRVCLQVRFMLETLLALKNNDMRKIPGYDPEPLERLRKLQRALVGTLLPGHLRCRVCANPREVPEGGGATGQVPAQRGFPDVKGNCTFLWGDPPCELRAPHAEPSALGRARELREDL